MTLFKVHSPAESKTQRADKETATKHQRLTLAANLTADMTDVAYQRHVGWRTGRENL